MPAQGGEPPMQGFGLTAYDNMLKKYTSIWFDSMSTGFMILHGDWDPKENALVMSGESPNPMTGQKSQKWRTVGKIESNDRNTMTMYTTSKDGKEYKCMEIAYTRTKDSGKAAPAEKK
jgi:hypothetical protein